MSDQLANPFGIPGRSNNNGILDDGRDVTEINEMSGASSVKSAFMRVGVAMFIVTLVGVACYMVIGDTSSKANRTQALQKMEQINNDLQSIYLLYDDTRIEEYDAWTNGTGVPQDVDRNFRTAYPAMKENRDTYGTSINTAMPEKEMATRVFVPVAMCEALVTAKTVKQWTDTPTPAWTKLDSSCRKLVEDMAAYNANATAWNSSLNTIIPTRGNKQALPVFTHGNTQ